jgi:hypothetical protein
MAEEEAAAGLKKAAARADRAMRVAGGEGDATPEQRLEALWQKGELEFAKKAAAAEELEQAMQRLAKKLRLGRMAMDELNRRRCRSQRQSPTKESMLPPLLCFIIIFVL